MFCILSSHGEFSSSSREAFAIAQAKGFAIKVGPCISTFPFASTPFITFLLVSVAASDIYPPVSALPIHKISGATPACS